MNGFKKLLKAFLIPHWIVLLLLVPILTVLLIYSFLAASPEDVVSIVSYALSFYTLMTLCIRIPQIVRQLRKFWQENKYVLRYRSDVRLRVNLSLFSSLVLNVGFSVFQFGLGLYHASIWFYAMACYYALLAGMRILLAGHARKYGPGEKRLEELKKYRFCGVFLLLMTLSLFVIILYIVWQNRTFRHHEITTIAMAVFTFASLTMAIVQAIQYRKYDSPVYSAAKAISLVSSAVSMLTLEAEMLTAFDNDSSELFKRIMLGATGAATVLFIQGMAIRMIVIAHRKIRFFHNS